MDRRALPDDDTVATALALALRAPSRGNSQPWRWQITPNSMHLYLDRSRSRPVIAGEERDVLLGCGAVLHHLSVAFAALGWATIVHRMPNPDDDDHLAAVTAVPRRPTNQDIAMSAAITRRRSDRRLYSDWTAPPGYLGLLTERAAALGAMIRLLRDRSGGSRAFEPRPTTQGWAADSAFGSPGPYDLENAAAYWTTSTHSEHAPAGSAAADEIAEPDHADLLLLATPNDDRLAHLRAGEAMSAVLLTATNIGLATCPLSAPLDSADQRLRLRHDALDDTAHPQVILRVGQAPDATDLPPLTPRRSLAEILSPVHA
ncbi:nitroreductase family protein [Nocardia bhagyanarayanae]|uniref:Nitroreductase family protein n=2 Tax=Nocardia bhagyanarayanae TaxID=1215925 RepID=A0A543FF79_9NOCA|nr:nitroreductase family protein [Nocardia bhagyanarayanae]